MSVESNAQHAGPSFPVAAGSWRRKEGAPVVVGIRVEKFLSLKKKNFSMFFFKVFSSLMGNEP